MWNNEIRVGKNTVCYGSGGIRPTLLKDFQQLRMIVKSGMQNCKCAYREDRKTFTGLDASGLEITCQPSAAVRRFNNSIPRKTIQHTSNRLRKHNHHNRMINTDDGTHICDSENLLLDEAEFPVGRSSSAGVGSVRIHLERESHRNGMGGLTERIKELCWLEF
jgi:hypothetical protein